MNTGQSSLRPWAWASWGTGAAALVAGVTLIALNTPKVKNGIEQPSYRPTLVPGIATASAEARVTATAIKGGSALMVLGVW